MTKQYTENKREGLRTLPGDRLSKLTGTLGVSVAEGASHEDCLAALAQASDEHFTKALELLTRAELSAICSKLGLPSTARTQKNTLVRTVLAATTDAPPPAPDADSASGRSKPRTAPRRRGSAARNKRQQKAKAEREHERQIREPGWAHIDATTLASFDSTDFTRLCFELLSIEADERNAGTISSESAPRGEQTRAEQDLRCTVVERPRVSVEQYSRRWHVSPLIADTPGITAFRCRAGASWRKDAARDAKSQRDWARDVLQAGGRLVILTNESRKRRREKTQLEHRMASSYAKLMKDRNPDIDDLAQRIIIIPAEDLALYIRSRRPIELSLQARNLLGVARIPNVIDFETWACAHLPSGRDDKLAPAEFEWDDHRKKVRDQLLRMLAVPSEDPYSQVAWLDGHSGVGKTRMLIEVMRDRNNLRSRALVAPSIDAAIGALSAHRLFEQYPTALLIIAECPAQGLVQLIPWLERYNHRGIGGLIVLTALSESGDGAWDDRIPPVLQRCRMNIEPLARSAYNRLIARELGVSTDAPDVARIAEVTEGAPWLATLVARATAAGAPVPSTAAEATDLAICAHDEPDRQAQLDLRVRVLLLMMLIGDLDWHTLTRADRVSLCQAVGVATFDDVERGRAACMARGLLRVHLGPLPERVTPLIVAREVAKSMLQPTVEGPAPQATPLGEHARRLLPALYRRLEPLGLDRLIAVQLAAPIARALEFEAPGVTVMGQSAVGRAELVFATRHQLPQRVARVLGRRIAGSSMETLRDRVDIRSALVEALEHLVGRKWSFERAENALFRLVLAENQLGANNATSTWANLFAIEGHQTYRSFLVRLSLLHKRCTDGELSSRLVALEGFRVALTVNPVLPPGEARDGPYPEIARGEAFRSRLAAWKLLLKHMVHEQTASVAAEIAVACLEDTIEVGLENEVSMRLADVAASLPEPTRRMLRRKVGELHDAQKARTLKPSSDWEPLLSALAPTTYAAMLRERVGNWSTNSAEEEALDRDLARRGIAGLEQPLLDDLAWLASDDAVRRAAFATAIGLEDSDRQALDPLVALTRTGQGAELLASYLLGWQRANRESDVMQVLRALRVDSELSAAVARTVWHLGPNEQYVDILLELLDRGTLDDDTLQMFERGTWFKGLNTKSLARLARALLARDTQKAAELACKAIVQCLGNSAGSKKQWRTLLEKGLRGATVASGDFGTYWQQAAYTLVRADVDINELILTAAMHEHRPLESHAAWRVFNACAERNPQRAWETLVTLCQQADAVVARRVAHTLGRHDISKHFAPSEVMSWVGDDQRRATWVSRMLSVHDTDVLPDLAYDLLVKFGPSSTAATKLLHAAAHPPPNVNVVLADFHAVQIARARHWSQDSTPEIRDWASGLIALMEKHLQTHPAGS